MKRDCTLNLTL